MKTILLTVSILAAGCGGAQQRTEALTETIRSYNDGVRWERFAVAAVAVPPAERSEFVDDMDERAKDLRISDYEIVKVDPKGDKLAEVQVKLSWYLDSVGTLRETHAMQTWERKGKVWWIVKEERFRGDEMPGLPEPVKPDAPAATDEHSEHDSEHDEHAGADPR